MKKILIPIILSALAVFTACNQDLLDIPQKGVVTTDTFYQNDEEAEAAMVAAYQGFIYNICSEEGASIYAPYRAVFNLCGDDMYAAGEYFGDNDFMGAMNEFRYDNSSEVVRNAYQNIYYAMYYSNLVIEKFTRDDATPVMKRVVAEARVLRAWMHMMLAIGWGTPPLVDNILAAADNPYNCNNDPDTPMTHEEILKWCANECLEALPNLNERQSPADKDGAVKVTKGFANAVAGKALLFAGDYAGAKSALKAVIESGKYQLVPGERYWENFHIEGDANEEKIFETNIEVNDNIGVWGGIIWRTTWMEANIWNWRSDHFVANPSTSYSSIDGWGGCGVPTWFADEFIANDGLESHRLNATIISIEDVVYNSVYNLPVDELTLEQKKVSKDLGIDLRGLYGQSFYLPLKPVARVADLYNPGNNVRVNNYVIMRYAEVLLLYAEACLQTGDNAGALDAVNQIQRRAGSKTVSSSVDMNVIEREKKLELWLEGCRWPDMVRWGKFEQAKQAGQNVTVLYDRLTREPQSGDENVTWLNNDPNERFYLVTTHAAKDRGDQIGFQAGKHERFPFPYTVTSKNPNLVQNPGWE